MATKRTVTAELSENAKGFRNIGFTKDLGNGKKQEFKLLHIAIDAEENNNMVRVFYTRQEMTNDETLKGPLVRDSYALIDEPAVYEIEVDEEGNEIEGTRVEIKPETLNITAWDAEVGELFQNAIVNHLNKIHG